jgi:hypothetical protein
MQVDNATFSITSSFSYTPYSPPNNVIPAPGTARPNGTITYGGALDMYLPFIPPRLGPGEPDPNMNTTFSLIGKELFIEISDSNIYAEPKAVANVSLPGLREWADFTPLV